MLCVVSVVLAMYVCMCVCLYVRKELIKVVKRKSVIIAMYVCMCVCFYVRKELIKVVKRKMCCGVWLLVCMDCIIRHER